MKKAMFTALWELADCSGSLDAVLSKIKVSFQIFKVESVCVLNPNWEVVQKERGLKSLEPPVGLKSDGWVLY